MVSKYLKFSKFEIGCGNIFLLLRFVMTAMFLMVCKVTTEVRFVFVGWGGFAFFEFVG
jgi:hypothetical protein